MDAMSGAQHRLSQLCDRLVEYMDTSRGGVLSVPIGDLLVTWTHAPSPEHSTQELLPFIDSIALATDEISSPSTLLPPAVAGADAAGISASPPQHGHASGLDVVTHDDGVDLQVDYRNGKDKATMKASFRHLHVSRGSDSSAQVRRVGLALSCSNFLPSSHTHCPRHAISDPESC